MAIITQGRLRAAGTLDEIMRQVRQKRLIEVQLPSRNQLAAAARLLRETLGDEASVVASEAEAIVRFQTNRSDDDLGEVLTQLVGAGIRVVQFRAVVSDLEDAFLTVTRDDAEAAESLCS